MTENSSLEEGKFKKFLKKQGVEISWRRYLVDALGAMALGLFASLLIGTIMNTVGSLLPGDTEFAQFLIKAGEFASKASGAAMSIAIAYSLNAPPLVLYSMVAVGISANQLGGAGGPLAVFIIAIITTELGKFVSKTTPVDVIVTPTVTILSGVGLSYGIAPTVGYLASLVGAAIIQATNIAPFLMGIVVSVLMGIALTLPISSAAIAAAFGLTGLAGGAAYAGCCAQMVGFAVMSFKENRWSGLLSQGVGTSMLQMPNIVKNPKVWIPPILASAVTGPLATTLFKLEMNGAPISSGMGTSGLVGQIGLITGWLNPSEAALAHGATTVTPGIWEYSGMLLIGFVLPAILTLLFAYPMRKKSWIKSEDLKLNLG